MKESDKLPVILLHGWGGSFQSIYANTGWLEALKATGRSVFPVDLPGHGSWDESDDPRHYSDMVSLLDARLPNGKFDAVSFSLGAKLLLELCIRQPGRVRRAVFGGLGDNAFAVHEPAGQVVAEALEKGVGADTPEPIKRLVDYALFNGGNPASMAAVLCRPPNPNITPERVGTITTPSLLVNGSQDNIALPDGRLSAALAGHYLALKSLGHIDLTGNKAFIAAAVTFINKLQD